MFIMVVTLITNTNAYYRSVIYLLTIINNMKNYNKMYVGTYRL